MIVVAESIACVSHSVSVRIENVLSIAVIPVEWEGRLPHPTKPFPHASCILPVLLQNSKKNFHFSMEFTRILKSSNVLVKVNLNMFINEIHF